jgi:site-specific recombinase XerD
MRFDRDFANIRSTFKVLFFAKGGDHANRRLKHIIKACGVEKPVSRHCSRHSFACLALNIGEKLEAGLAANRKCL